MASYNLSVISNSNITNNTQLDIGINTIMTYTLTSLGSVTVLMNMLVLVMMIRFSWMRSNANIILASMAVTDLIAGASAFTAGLVKWSDLLKVSHTFCLVYNALDIWIAHASLFHVLMINFERYLAIVMPFRYHRLLTHCKLGLSLILVWIISGVLGVLYVVFTHYEDKCLQGLYKSAAGAFAVLTTVFPIPLLVIFGMYSHIIVVVVQKLRFLQKHSNKQNNSEAKCKMIRTVTIILAAYVICWGPTIGTLLVVTATTFLGIQVDLSPYVQFFYFVEVLSHANSLANPVIYFVLGKDFRKGASMLCRCKGQTQNMTKEETIVTTKETTMANDIESTYL